MRPNDIYPNTLKADRGDQIVIQGPAGHRLFRAMSSKTGQTGVVNADDVFLPETRQPTSRQVLRG